MQLQYRDRDGDSDDRGWLESRGGPFVGRLLRALAPLRRAWYKITSPNKYGSTPSGPLHVIRTVASTLSSWYNSFCHTLSIKPPVSYIEIL